MKSVGVVGALDNDIIFLLDLMHDVKVNNRASKKFYSGIINGYKVVIASTGIGKINAAIVTQILFDDYNIDFVINIGIAGSLNSHIEIGDIVFSADAIQHDVDLSSVGCPLGVIPKMPTSIFVAERNLIELMQKICCKNVIDNNIYTGRIASGDQFISSLERKEYIHNTFKADCTDMEGAAIAQVAILNKKSFLLIKYISDKADDKAKIEYKNNSINLSSLFKDLIRELLNYI